MKILRKHRIISGLLAGVFAVFNIGIPIVISSCPMGSMASGGCSACFSPGDYEQLLGIRNTSCCETVVVAEPGTDAFDRTSQDLRHEVRWTSILGNDETGLSNARVAVDAPLPLSLSSLHPPDDLHIFNCVLLI